MGVFQWDDDDDDDEYLRLVYFIGIISMIGIC